jgi:acyl-CoA synthetase (AMP-forming)/AMP-acid ligase II
MHPGIHAAANPEKPALIMAGSGQRLTCRELDDRSLRLANLLRSAGLAKGDVIASLTDNSIHAYEIYGPRCVPGDLRAAVRSGMYACAVNNHLRAAEVAYTVNDSGASALVVSAALGELAEDVADQVPEVSVRTAYGGGVRGYEDYEQAHTGKLVKGKLKARYARS